MHHFPHVLDLVDMFVDESVMQETMAVVKPLDIIVKELIEHDFGFVPYQASWERMQTKM